MFVIQFFMLRVSSERAGEDMRFALQHSSKKALHRFDIDLLLTPEIISDMSSQSFLITDSTSQLRVFSFFCSCSDRFVLVWISKDIQKVLVAEADCAKIYDFQTSFCYHL